MMSQKQQQRLIGTLLLVFFITMLAYIVLSKVSQNESQRQATVEDEPGFSSLIEPIQEQTDDESAGSDTFSTGEEAFVDIQAERTTTTSQPADNADEPVLTKQPPAANEEKETTPVQVPEPVKQEVVTPSVPEDTVKTEPAPTKVPAPEPKPEPPKPIVENKPEPAPAPAVETEPQWILQLGSFSVEENATKLKKQLEDIGYKPMIEQTRSAGTVIYRVRLQPNTDRSTLEKTAASIRQQLNLNTQIFPYQ